MVTAADNLSMIRKRRVNGGLAIPVAAVSRSPTIAGVCASILAQLGATVIAPRVALAAVVVGQVTHCRSADYPQSQHGFVLVAAPDTEGAFELPTGEPSGQHMIRTDLVATLMARGQLAAPILSAREMLDADQTLGAQSRPHPARCRW